MNLDYVKYDTEAQLVQTEVLRVTKDLECCLVTLSDGRSKSIAITKLEEFYMWAGKAIRDDQLLREKTEKKYK